METTSENTTEDYSKAVPSKFARALEIRQDLRAKGLDHETLLGVIGDTSQVLLIGLCTTIAALYKTGSKELKAELKPIIPIVLKFNKAMTSGDMKTTVNLKGLDKVLDDIIYTTTTVSKVIAGE